MVGNVLDRVDVDVAPLPAGISIVADLVLEIVQGRPSCQGVGGVIVQSGDVRPLEVLGIGFNVLFGRPSQRGVSIVVHQLQLFI